MAGPGVAEAGCDAGGAAGRRMRVRQDGFGQGSDTSLGRAGEEAEFPEPEPEPEPGPGEPRCSERASGAASVDALRA